MSRASRTALAPDASLLSGVAQAPLPVPLPLPARENVVAEYAGVLRRHSRAILMCALVGLALAVISTVATRPLYRTRTSIDVQTTNGNFMQLNEVSRVGSESSDTAQQTQIKLLESDALSARTVRSLLQDPHPQRIASMDSISRLLRALHLSSGTSVSYEATVRDAAARLKVKPLGVTRLIELNCEGWDPAVAQALCNRLVREYKSQDVETRSDEAQSTSTFLSRQLADIKSKAMESQRKLEDAVGNNGLMLSQETNSTGEERLRELQTELVRAEADRMQRESDASVARTATADTLPNVMDNPTYRAYQTQLADLQSKLAAMVPTLTEANPKVIHLRAQIAEAEAGLAAARATSSGRQNNEVAAARHREALLQVSYNAQLASVSSDLQKAAQVSLLRREVESEQQLYQTMLQRAKEAGFALAMQSSTVRVIDAAALPASPVSPRPLVSSITGLALASLLGAGFFLLRDRSRHVLRLPGQAAHLLRLHELGVIPHADLNPEDNLLERLRTWRSRNLSTEVSAPQQRDTLAMSRWNDRFSIVAEAYRSTSFSILLENVPTQARIYVVTSPSDGDGKTTVTSNIGVALSRSHLRVVLVDGDMRRPRMHRSFGMRGEVGLRNVLRGEVDVEHVPLDQLVQSTGTPNLFILPAGVGSEDTNELLHSTHVDSLLQRLSQNFDIVLIDTPPMLHIADARVLAERSNGTILVFRAGETTVQQAQQARDLLDRDGIEIIGSVLNAFEPAREGIPTYYASYERYQSQDKHGEPAQI